MDERYHINCHMCYVTYQLAGEGPLMVKSGVMARLVTQVTRPAAIAARVLDELREAIVSGVMQPGQVYSVPRLAEEFQVSASPVREAMVTLVGEGVVTPVPNKGFRVAENSDSEMEEIFALRLMLEVPGTVRLADLDLASSYDEIEKRVAATEVAAASGDVAAFLSSDRDFHLYLLELGGWVKMIEIVSRLRTQTRLYGFSQLTDTRMLLDAASEHRDIFRAITAQDAIRVENLIRAHLGHIRTEWAGLA